jgi:iron complex outermembrane receptor protein
VARPASTCRAARSRWAFGAQYRQDEFSARYSDLNNFADTPCVNSVKTGILGTDPCTDAQLAAPTGALLFLGGADDRDLDRDISAIFAELSLPITDSFQAQLAARYEDYGGGIGSSFDPKLSLRWQLVDSFALRGSVGTTFRGPALTQSDPSSVTTLQNVAGTFRAIRTFGDPNLKPESATTFNVGMLVKAAASVARSTTGRSISPIRSSTSRSPASEPSCSAQARPAA